MTPNHTLEWVAEQNDQRIHTGLRRVPRVRSANSDLVDLASNDYLGLATDPRVIAAAVDAARLWGAGSTGSRLVTGSTNLHIELEEALAKHVGAPAGRVFSSGYLANIAAITTLVDSDTLVISDELNHASLIDAIRLARARRVVVGHRDVNAVATALAERQERKAIIVTDAVFSVDGDLAPLAELHALACEHGAMLIVDEAHSLGVIGDHGQGAAAAAGISGEANVVLTLTLSKSLGSQGGAVVADPSIIELLTSAARTFIFDTALAPACAAAALEALHIIEATPQLVSDVRSHASALQWAAEQIGWQSTTPNGAVISLLVGEPQAAVVAADACARRGVWVGCFRPPSVPDGVSRLRLTARANLGDGDLARTVQALAQAADEIGIARINDAESEETL